MQQRMTSSTPDFVSPLRFTYQFELKDVPAKTLEVMNQGLSRRLSKRKVRDASRNAVVHLGVFAELLSSSITEDSLREALASISSPVV